MESYFSKTNTGGSFASKGFEYQDYCCLSSLFSTLIEKNFLSLSVETINDFTILFDTCEISVQVKKQHINLNFARSLLEEIKLEKDMIYEFIGTSIDESLANLMTKVLWFKNITHSNRNQHEKEKAKNSFINELKKIKFDGFYEKLLNVRFLPIPEEMASLALYAKFSYWVDVNKTNYNKEDLLNALLLKVSKMRSERSYLTKKEIARVISKYESESIYSEIIDKLYDRKFKTTSEILNILGEDKEDILKSLEVQLDKADKYIKDKKYNDALRIYSSLAVFYEKEQIYINCAMLYEMTDNYLKAIDYCQKVLNLESNNFEAYFILGTSHGQIGQTDKSLEYLKKALKLKETPEIFYNLGYTYYLLKENDKAHYNYSKCLELDDNMASAHLNISDLTADKLKAIQHLDRAIEINDQMYQAYAKKGEILRNIGLYDISIKYFEKCLELDEKNFQALLGISFSLMDLGKNDESIIFLSKWIKEFKQSFFSTMKIGQSTMYVDINWHRTRLLTFKKEDNENIILNMPEEDVRINIFDDKSYIFIGAAIDETGIISFPFVGKKYDLEQDYERIKNNLISYVDIKKIDENHYIDGRSLIKIIVRKYSQNTFISITVGNFKMSGFTEGNNLGIKYFMQGLELRNCLCVIIKCNENNSDFLIEGITDITIEKIDDEPLEHKTNNISEDTIFNAMDLDK